ncbi:MAG: phosphoribosylglycinamide formyltransferase [Pseudobutyrivibrio sp.]|nr:phosphoribosylglycinamide formyltransferase [Pseudobutyrivibrio sp.]
MMKIAVLVSGGGTNLQAIIDSIAKGDITNTEIAVVISNNKNAYALERAKNAGIEALCISPKDFDTREEFNEAFLAKLDSYEVDLVVLAGFLVVIPEMMIAKYRGRIINIHPSLIPSFCGTGFYGLKVHEAALERGVKVTGATVHFVDEGTDTGPIIMQKAVEIPEGITAKELQQKVMEEAEWKILPAAINMIANRG